MRYLLVGLGNLGAKRRAALGDRCVATVDPVNRAADFVSHMDCAPDAYEAAVLSVPNEAKLDLVEYFLRRGKHVLVEKPLMISADQAARLSELARDSGAIWYTAYNHRFEPGIVQLEQALDEGLLGTLYYGRLFYGNGTAGDVRGSWREKGLGVIEDLGSHLLDLLSYLLGTRETLVPWSVERHELACPDHCLAATADGRFLLEMSFLSWKNTFSIDLIGERGSAHLNGLRKWGGSELAVRQRVLPSGRPIETVQRFSGEDVTWAVELDEFDRRAAAGVTSAENDLWISRTLQALGAPEPVGR